MYWTTKDGRKLRVSEMETDHIERVIDMLDDIEIHAVYPDGIEFTWDQPIYKALKEELEVRRSK